MPRNDQIRSGLCYNRANPKGAAVSYFLFFYSYALVLATTTAFAGFFGLYIRQRKRLYKYVALLFGLYLVDITFLWMTESIPEFSALFNSLHRERPYLYTLFNTTILLTYRLILGDLLDYPPSNHEAALWLLCITGIVSEWYIRNELYRVAVDLVFPNLLHGWTALSGMVIYLHQGKFVEGQRKTAALALAAILVIEGILLFIPSPGIRTISYEITGGAITLYGLAFLASRLRIARDRIDDLQPLKLVQTYGLTRREEELLKLLLDHKTNREISEELTISIGTVKTHVHHIYEKIGVTSRKELETAALRAEREDIV